MLNQLSELIECSNEVSSFITDYYKITKVIGECYIYPRHVRNKNNDIFIDSVRVESVLHTVYYKIVINDQIPTHIKIELINDFHDKTKNTIYLNHYPKLCRDYETIITHNSINIINTNNNLYFCNHNDPTWGHTMLYTYSQIYFYTILKDYIPNLILVMSFKRPAVDYILNLLDIDNILIINNNDLIINKGITYFAGNFKANFSNNIINNFYYDTIVKNTLIKFPIATAIYPKKLLLLRNSSNISTSRLLRNRDTIVNICSKYGYVDFDHTLLSENDVIHLINKATHIIFEAGGSTQHLLWSSSNTKSIIINYDYTYVYICAKYIPDANEYLKLISDNHLLDIAINKKSTILYNDINFIKTNIIDNNKNNNMFENIDGLIEAIKNNE